MMNISLLRRHTLNHKESFIGVSIVISLPLFSSNAERSRLDVHTPLWLSSAYGSAVESEYKLSIYKLWQYSTKNKTSIHNEKDVYSSHKTHSYIQLDSVLCQYSSKAVEETKNDTIQSTSINLQKRSSLESNLSFCKHSGRSINWHNVFGFVLYIHTISRMLVHVQNILRKYKIYNCKKQDFRQNKHASPSYENTLWQYSKEPHKIGVYINKIFYHRVCCS
ncbi:hypothetical protein MCO_00711 [Bartonella sp. DB5-6]|nr:hypothetical protein MCO_00711 [Bartonella sp. DB5-6]